MKGFCALFCLVLLFTSCHRQQVKEPDLIRKQLPEVIDFPAGVMITPGKQITTASHRNTGIAQKLLTQRQIPFLDSTANEVVFVKTNGDRVSLSMDALAGKYEIILFNGINNPVPMRIADLSHALSQVFSFGETERIRSKNRRIIEKNRIPLPDSLPAELSRERVGQVRNHDRRIVVATADTSSQKFIARIIPGIQWIQQRVDTRKIVSVDFANDIITYNNTDRYFTNGITIGLQAAWLGLSPVQKLMLPYRHKAFVAYKLSIVQDMYTPTDTRMAPSLSNDRPYASYLYLGFRKTLADPLRRLKIASQLDLGYLGPYSPGSYLQTMVHKTFPTNDMPLGWETQINTDIILNYTVHVQKAILMKENITLLAGGEVKAGTLYTNAGAGLQLQAGKAEPVFGLSENEQWTKTEYYFFARTNVHFVAYNALLQGGMFNHNNVFTLQGTEIQHVVGDAEAGIHFRYKNFGIELAQHYISPEYKGGLWHKWGRISLMFGL